MIQKVASLFLALMALFAMPSFLQGQALDNAKVAAMIKAYQEDPRGPYKDIRWFCENGEVKMPKEPCEGKGVQRARYKDEVDALGRNSHVFLGQILSNTPKSDVWDEKWQHSRLKQYQLGKYLMGLDDGWVLRKGQYYRGAFQAEDEEKWGIDFFKWLLAKDSELRSKFFLIRQAAKDVPHQGDDSKTQSVRAISKIISESYADFMDLRIKIHGQPEPADIDKVKEFLRVHESKMGPENAKRMQSLILDMEALYAPVQLSSLERYQKQLSAELPLTLKIAAFVQSEGQSKPGPARFRVFGKMIWDIREDLLTEPKAKGRLALLDISIKLEQILFQESNSWRAANLQEKMEEVFALAQAAAGAGFLERWEWKGTNFLIDPPKSEQVSLGELGRIAESSRRMVEWGTGTVRANYNAVVMQYAGFEPKAYGFQDNIIRSSILLPFGHAVAEVGDLVSKESQLSNQVLSIGGQSSFRGVNPGFAKGELVVVDGDEDEVEVSPNKIYVFNRPPADLKPVAGIFTVTEGNIVSHVQLLARNLGIPNAVLSMQNLKDLKAFNGKEVFYAVSNKGTVLMKPVDQMNGTEQELFAKKERSEEKISVPFERLNLEQRKVVNMRELRATDSGKLCGPKAANLGQLKYMFPDNVVEGFVIPFGIFKYHLDKPMPGVKESYWEYLKRIFKEAAQMREMGQGEPEVEAYVLKELENFRALIKAMSLDPEFVKDINDCFLESFGQPIGKVPVFLRSDTNMEDLKDFTGAGLNLTLFNVVEPEKIMNGIKEVWASPYTERSYKWRQKYLLDPENIFPSILVIPSVDVNYSGVMITKGIVTDNDEDITIAFSRGAGGAVDGQAAESFLLRGNGGTTLISPAREPSYRSLPVTGGTGSHFATFELPILNTGNLKDLRKMAQEIKKKMVEGNGVASQGPWDIELGFKDNKIWLFQVRPFVENKNALASNYLKSITPEVNQQRMIKVLAPIQN